MVLKKSLCLLLTCLTIFGCFSVPAAAVGIDEQAIDISERRATGHFDFEIPENTIMRASNSFPMEYGETVTIRATFSPASASMDFGLIDSDGTFYSVRAEDGSINHTIRIDQRGNYIFAIRNNSSYSVHVSGFVNY